MLLCVLVRIPVPSPVLTLIVPMVPYVLYSTCTWTTRSGVSAARRASGNTSATSAGCSSSRLA
eukprot:6173701-Alexandrium_andersonii.AAC.1